MDFAIGVKGGIGYGFFRGADYQELLDLGTSAVEPFSYFRTNFMLSYSGGVYAELGLFNFLSIQPEAIITNAGGAYGFPENAEYYKYKEFIKMTYAELPVLLRIRFTRSSGSFDWRRYCFYGGPGIAFLLGDGKLKAVSGGEEVSQKLPPGNLADSYYFAVVGAGIDMGSFSSNTFTSIEIRYHMGLSSIMHPDMNSDDFMENNIQLLLGFAFGSIPNI